MKKVFKLLFVMIPILLIFIPGYTQSDTTSIPGGTGTTFLDKILENMAIVIPAVLVVFEAITRLIPTSKDWSLFNKLTALLQMIMDKFLPNKTRMGTQHENKIK